MNARRFSLIGVVFLCGILMAGCSKDSSPPSDPKRNVELQEDIQEDPTPKEDLPQSDSEEFARADLRLFTGGYKIIYENNEQTPPENEKELRTVISSDRPIVFDKYVIIWSVDLAHVADPNNTVLAYSADVPKDGGMVAFVSGSRIPGDHVQVRRVTAEQFKTLVKATPLTKMEDRKADFSMSAADFVSEFRKDQKAMKEKYKNKIVELKGIVGLFHGDSGVYLQVDDDRRAAPCGIKKSSQPWARVAKGQEVTIKGLYPEKDFGQPGLNNAVLVSPPPNAAILTNPKDLVDEFVKDPEATSKKYAGKSMILSGEIVSSEKNKKELFVTTVRLKGTDDNPLVCHFHSVYSPEEQKLLATIGAKIKLYGEFAINSSEKKMLLDECLLIME